MKNQDTSKSDNWRGIDRRTALQGLAGATLGTVGVSGTASAGEGCNFIVNGIYIQDAIDEANPGDTICFEDVEQDVLEGGILVDKELTIRPLEDGNRLTLDATGVGVGIKIRANHVTLKGTEVVGDERTLTGIRINTGTDEEPLATDDILLENNQVSGMAKAADSFCYGIRSGGEQTLSGLVLNNNVVENVGGPNLEQPAGIGLELQDLEGEKSGDGAEIEENELRGITNGDDQSGIAIAINRDDGETSGADTPGAKIEKNPIDASDGVHDILLGSSGGVTVESRNL